jgi:zinc protease
VVGNYEIGLQTNEAQSNQASFDDLYGLGFDRFQKYAQLIEKVSREDVQRVCRKYIDLENYALAVIRPPVRNKE